MYQSAAYPAVSREEIHQFIRQQFHGKLIAIDPSGYPVASLLPFVFEPGTNDDWGAFEIHMVQGDATAKALQQNPRAGFLLDEPLAFTPHIVTDPDDGGKSTLHFRAVMCQVDATVMTDPAVVAQVLERLLTHYQPGIPRRPVRPDAFYQSRLERLAAARLKVRAVEAKFKLAQNRTEEERAALIQYLRQRGGLYDSIAADALETELRRNP